MTASLQEQEINEIRAEKYETRRATVPAVEEILYEQIPVLDHGFIRVVDYMGDDSAIVQAARVSYGKGTKQVSKDAGLIRYLMRHWHTTPFEMCELKLHVKLPMFVARQWIRHRTANVNEYSARYSVLDREFYIPNKAQLASQSVINNQGRGETLSGEEAEQALKWLRDDADQCYDHYQSMINEDPAGNTIDDSKQGLARELARMNLPVNAYTQWYWKIDLHNLFHFLHLRADPHAQYEIRVYADAIFEVVKKWLPIAAQAFEDYRMGAAHLSAQGVTIVSRMLNGEKVTQETSGLSKREWTELMATLEQS